LAFLAFGSGTDEESDDVGGSKGEGSDEVDGNEEEEEEEEGGCGVLACSRYLASASAM